MDVKRCDRCGAIYEWGMENNFVVLMDTPRLKSDMRMPCYRMTYNGKPTDMKDICPACAESFTKWFEGGAHD